MEEQSTRHAKEGRVICNGRYLLHSSQERDRDDSTAGSFLKKGSGRTKRRSTRNELLAQEQLRAEPDVSLNHSARPRDTDKSCGPTSTFELGLRVLGKEESAHGDTECRRISNSRTRLGSELHRTSIPGRRIPTRTVSGACVQVEEAQDGDAHLQFGKDGLHWSKV